MNDQPADDVAAAPWDPCDTVTYRFYPSGWRSPVDELRDLPAGSRVTFKWPSGEQTGTITRRTPDGGVITLEQTPAPTTCDPESPDL